MHYHCFSCKFHCHSFSSHIYPISFKLSLELFLSISRNSDYSVLPTIYTHFTVSHLSAHSRGTVSYSANSNSKCSFYFRITSTSISLFIYPPVLISHHLWSNSKPSLLSIEFSLRCPNSLADNPMILNNLRIVPFLELPSQPSPMSFTHWRMSDGMLLPTS